MRNFLMFFFLLQLVTSCGVNNIKEGKRVGKWRYQNATDLKEGNVVEGRYDKNGLEKGIWLYYENNKRIRKEVYHKNYCINYLFYSNGNLSEFGLSKQFIEGDMIFWKKTGNWFLFDDQGVVTSMHTY